MAYEFTDTNATPTYTPGVQTIFGGVNIDEALQGKFETLNVTGRGLIAPEVLYTERVGADGAWLDSANLPVREIDVEARITGASNEEARAVYNELNRLLHGGIKALKFSDEPGFTFQAIAGQIKEPKEDQNTLIANIIFLCLDPWKYSEPIASGATIPASIDYPTIPDQIKLTLTAATTQVKVTNPRTGKNIVLNGGYSAGQIITLIFGETPQILLGSVSAMTHLNILSDFELFDVLGNDSLTVTPPGTLIEVTIRRRQL